MAAILNFGSHIYIIEFILLVWNWYFIMWIVRIIVLRTKRLHRFLIKPWIMVHVTILDFYRLFYFKNLLPRVLFFCYIAIYNHTKFYATESLLISFCLHSMKYVLKCDISGHFEFWFLMTVFSQRQKDGIQ